jgi:tetratricopeptide (TPR) repeat protein
MEMIMTSIKLTVIFMALVLLSVYSGNIPNSVLLAQRAQGPATLPDSDAHATIDMSSQEFTRWLKARRKEADINKTKPTEIKQAVLARLQANRTITDDTVVSAVNAYVSYESARSATNASTRSADFREPLGFIDEIVPLIADRPVLLARLHQCAGYLLRTKGDIERAIAEYERAVILLKVAAIEVEKAKVESILEIAEMHYLRGEKEKAIAAYLQVLSFDWYKVEDPKARQDMMVMYLNAGAGLIECRRNNLKALEDTYFVPATLGVLGPLLERAKREAEGKPMFPQTQDSHNRGR